MVRKFTSDKHFEILSCLNLLGRKCSLSQIMHRFRFDLAPNHVIEDAKRDFEYKKAKLEHMYPASAIAAQWVKQNLLDCKKVRYIGMEPMGEEIRSNGLEPLEVLWVIQNTTSQASISSMRI